ncbi:MAG: HAD family hydrolase [Clostridia bacterium]|nr:HAD family hydrolase [Oscillospiraceae bacterium]MBQ7960856.1 HAD family hydrolase [Clostridia bacterium]
MEEIRNKIGFICDMDGVIYHGNKILDGVSDFVNWMLDNDKKFVFLTNSPERTPHELSMKLERMGLSVPPKCFYTSAMATAEFLHSQNPGCTAYVIGEAALTKSLYDKRIYMNDVDPDYVVVGETRTYSFEKLEKAIELVNKGAKLIGANPDITGPTERGIMPATGSLIAPIEIATGKKAYFVGKPNPIMIRHGLNMLECHSAEIAFIGDRMDTDIVAGVESNVDTVLVLSGVTAREDIDKFPYRPKYILNGVGDIVKG